MRFTQIRWNKKGGYDRSSHFNDEGVNFIPTKVQHKMMDLPNSC